MAGIQDPDKSQPSNDMLSLDCANAVFDICASEGLLLDDCSLKLDATADSIKMTLGSNISADHRAEYSRNKDGIIETILHSRYANLYKLLRVSNTSLHLFVAGT